MRFHFLVLSLLAVLLSSGIIAVSQADELVIQLTPGNNVYSRYPVNVTDVMMTYDLNNNGSLATLVKGSDSYEIASVHGNNTLTIANVNILAPTNSNGFVLNDTATLILINVTVSGVSSTNFPLINAALSNNVTVHLVNCTFVNLTGFGVFNGGGVFTADQITIINNLQMFVRTSNVGSLQFTMTNSKVVNATATGKNPMFLQIDRTPTNAVIQNTLFDNLNGRIFGVSESVTVQAPVNLTLIDCTISNMRNTQSQGVFTLALSAIRFILQRCNIFNVGSSSVAFVSVSSNAPGSYQFIDTTISGSSFAKPFSAYSGGAFDISFVRTTVQNCTFPTNSYICAHTTGFNGSLSIQGSKFIQNYAPNGILFDFNHGTTSNFTTMVIKDSIFQNNVQLGGTTAGGSAMVSIFIPIQSATIDNTQFIQNTNTANGAALAFYSSPIGYLEVSNSLFSGNTADLGAGIYLESSTALNVSLSNITVMNQMVTTSGGFLYCTSCTADVVISSSTFQNNQGQNGGCFGTSATGTLNLQFTGDNTFISNSAIANGGVMYSAKAAVSVSLGSATFSQNKAQGSGGALYFSTNSMLDLSLDGTVFDSNTAANGAGLYIEFTPCNATFQNSVFTNNVATTGAGINLLSSGNLVSFTNCTFAGNQATTGAGISTSGVTSLTFDQISFTSNQAQTGAALYLTESGSLEASNVNFETNTGSAGVVVVKTASSLASFSDISFSRNTGKMMTISEAFNNNLALTRITFDSNQDPSSSGNQIINIVDVIEGAINVVDCTFTSNFYPYGTLVSIDSATTVTNFQGNQFTWNNGGIIGVQNSAVVNIQSSDFVNNTSSDSQLVQLSLLAASEYATLAVSDCHITANTYPYIMQYSSVGVSSLQSVDLTNNQASVATFYSSNGELDLTSVQLLQSQDTQQGTCFDLKNIGFIKVTGSTIKYCNSITGVAVALVDEKSSLQITGSEVSHTTKSVGPAIQIQVNGALELSNSVLHDIDGVISATGVGASATISSCSFYNSDMTELAISNDAAFVGLKSGSTVSLTNVTFLNGNAGISSCISVADSSLSINGGSIEQCTSQRTGGALQATGLSSLSVQGTKFLNNRAVDGGAFSFTQLYASHIQFKDAVFSNNNGSSGGVFNVALDNSNSLTFINTAFSNNYASLFGGVFLASDSAIIQFDQCTFDGNFAEVGGVGYQDWNSNVTAISSTFTNNYATDNAGCLYLDKFSLLNLQGSTVTQSTAQTGSGGFLVLSFSSTFTASQSSFTGCSAASEGGVIYVPQENNCAMQISNSQFTKNSAGDSGGCIFFGPSSSNNQFVLNTVSFANNTANFGGAIAVESATYRGNFTNLSFSQNLARIHGANVNSPPFSITTTAVPFSIYSGSNVPTFSVNLLDSLGLLYDTLPTQPFVVYVTISSVSPVAQPPYLSGPIQMAFSSNGLVSFSTDSQAIKVFGYSGSYVMTVGPSISDPFYNPAHYSINIPFTLKNCTDGYYQDLTDLSCDQIICSGCPTQIGAVCVTPGNCSCPQGFEGLRCEFFTNAYDTIELYFLELPTLPTRRRDTQTLSPINVDMRTYLINLLTTLYASDNLLVNYFDFYQSGEYYVFKYALMGGTNTYIEGASLEVYQQQAISYFGNLLGNSSTSAVTSSLVAAPLDYLQPNEPGVIAVLVVTCILLALALFTLGAVIYYRSTPVVKSASPLFCSLILLGVILAYMFFIPYVGPQNNITCGAPVVIGPLAFALIFGNLLSKTFRIFKIFSNRKMRNTIPSNRTLLFSSAIVVVLEMIPVIAWLAYDPPVPVRVGDQGARYETCQSDTSNSFVIALCVYNGILLAIGTFLAFRTRKAFSAYRETQIIGFSIYTISLVAVIVLPIIFFVELPLRGLFVLRAFAVILVTAVTHLMLFGSKMFIIFVRPEQNTQSYFEKFAYADTSDSGLIQMNNYSSNISRTSDNHATVTKYSGWVVVKKGNFWGLWEKKYAVSYGEYFGFFKDENNIGTHESDGLYPMASWNVEKMEGALPGDIKLRLTLNNATYDVDAKSAELEKWYDILTGKALMR